MEEKIRRHIIFEGRVQGVGFRYRALYAAKQFGVTGWVRNLYDGTVEMEVQGREAEIDQMILSLEQGSYIRIDNLRVQRKEMEEEERAFRILD